MIKGSEIKSRAEKEELRRLVEEFTEKLETDPYQPGVVHPHLYADDIADIVDDVLWVRDHSEMTIHIKRNSDDSSITVTVIERKDQRQ